MRKYTLLAAILALCACNNGGGSSHSSGTYNTPTKPGITLPGTGNTDKNPEPEQPSQPTEPDVPDTPKEPDNPTPVEPDSPEQNEPEYTTKQIKLKGSKDYNGNYYRGYINKETNELYFEPIVQSLSNVAGGTNGSCKQTGGCVDLESAITVPLNELNDDNIVSIDENDNKILLGTKDMDTVLQFSDFGYWGQIKNNNETIKAVFAGGDTIKEINMHRLAEKDKITGIHTYSGNAIAGIYDKTSAKIKTGTAQLIFDANNGVPKESLNMDFSGSGWYKVSVNGDGSDLYFYGTADEDKIHGFPTYASDIDIQYYGSKSLETATETVGTMHVMGVYFQGENTTKDIDFSFGAVKD